MTTARTLMEVVGRHARVTLGGVPVIVKIVDAKNRYGTDRYHICPLFWQRSNRPRFDMGDG